MYYSWYPDYSGIIELDSSCLASYPQPSVPPFVNWRPGSRMVKLQISPDVYAVEPRNKLSKVGSEAVAAGLYGSNWAGQVVDVSDYFWPNYPNRGADVTEVKPHNGLLIQVSGSNTIYSVENGEKKMVVDGSVRGDVRVVSQAVADTVPTGTGTVSVASLYSNPSQGVGTATVSPTPGTPTPAPVTGGSLSVSLASDTPKGTYALASAARVPFTKVIFTAGSADATIDSFRVTRGGSPAKNSDFSTINLVDADGNLLNDSGKTLNSDNYAVFTEDITVPANTSKTYTIVGDMASTVGNGDVPVLQLDTMVLLNGGTATGLPLAGNAVTANNNVTLGSVTLAEGSTLNNSTKELGSTLVDLASLKITVATNDFQVERIVFYNSGTASDGDFSNFKINYNNNVITSGVMKNKYVTFDLKACTTDCLITKGNNKTFGVTGDIVNGSGRTMNLDISKTVHVLALDTKNGVYVTPTDNATAMTNTITVSTGKLSVSKTNDIPARDVPVNSTNVALGTFNFKVTGEPIDIRTLVFRVSTTGSMAPTAIDGLNIYNAAGLALIGGVDASGGSSPGYVTSTDTFTLPVGDNILTVKAKIDNTPGDGNTVRIDVDMNNTTNFDARGTTTGDTVTLGTYATPQAFITGNIMTIRTAQLRITTLSSPASTTYAGGVTDIECENVQLDATGSSEDIRVTQFQVKLNPWNGAKSLDIQNVRLFVDKDGDSGNGSGTQVALSTAQGGSDADANDDETLTINWSGADQFIVKAGKRLTVTVKCNITGGASTGTHSIYTNAASLVTAVGVTSGNSITPVADTAAGQGVTVGTAGGTVQVSQDPSNVVAKNYVAGTQGVELASFNLYATTTENVKIEKIYFTQRVTDTNSAAYQDYTLLYVTDSSGNVLGSVVPTSTKPLIQMNDNAVIVDRANSAGTKLILKANLNSIVQGGNVQIGGHRLGYNIAVVGDVVAKGSQSGADAVVYFGSTAPNGSTHYMYKAVPTVTILPPQGCVNNVTDPCVANTVAKLVSGSNDLYRFTVKAGTGDISVYKFSFDITTTSANVTAAQLVDITTTPEVQLYTSSTVGVGGYEYHRVLFDPSGICPNNVCGQGGQERVIGAGASRQFVFRGTVSGLGTSGGSVSTRLIGDSALPVPSGANAYNGYLLMASSTAVDTAPSPNFIWSDYSGGNHSTTTNDWTNGYLVTGLNSPSSTPTVVAQ